MSAATPSAFELATACSLAYDKFTLSLNGCQVLVQEFDNYVLVSFRGTEKNFGDIIRDMRAFPWYCRSDIGTIIHSGFCKSVRGWWGNGGIWPQLKLKLLKYKNKIIWITGHSLGGSEGEVLKARMVSEDWDPEPMLVTLGKPGTGRFKGKLGRISPIRIVYGDDTITKVQSTVYPHEGILLPIGRAMPGSLGGFIDHRMSGYLKETQNCGDLRFA